MRRRRRPAHLARAGLPARAIPPVIFRARAAELLRELGATDEARAAAALVGWARRQVEAEQADVADLVSAELAGGVASPQPRRRFTGGPLSSWRRSAPPDGGRRPPGHPRGADPR